MSTETSNALKLTVPLIPPSVNHYKRPRRYGHGFYVTEEARAFKDAVAIVAGGRSVEAKEYALDVHVYFGKGQKGDGDNLWKCIADSLVAARVIKTDAAVKLWTLRLGRDWDNPRTEIVVEAL